ncbi:MAG: hypothetical protein F6K10_01455 [Moorea sp. SIO2B7]|nr:hypothetical protein [Moorena sp. SIO2B7]
MTVDGWRETLKTSFGSAEGGKSVRLDGEMLRLKPLYRRRIRRNRRGYLDQSNLG